MHCEPAGREAGLRLKPWHHCGSRYKHVNHLRGWALLLWAPELGNLPGETVLR